jgi:hypothetical protein
MLRKNIRDSHSNQKHYAFWFLDSIIVTEIAIGTILIYAKNHPQLPLENIH